MMNHPIPKSHSTYLTTLKIVIKRPYINSEKLQKQNEIIEWKLLNGS